MGRAPCCDKSKVKRGPWSPEEDLRLKEFIEKNGTGGNWIALPQKAGLKRCGKSCRLRWLNYLRPNIKHGDFTDDEDRIICTLFSTIGSRWSIIASQLPGRTDNDIKNYWNTKLKKKLLGIPPSQRKSNHQNKQQLQQEQQQHHQQYLFTSSLSSNIANIVPQATNPSLLPSSHFVNAHDISYDYGSSLLTFGGQQQSCSSSDGLEFNNNSIYNSLLGDIDQGATTLDLYGNNSYEDIKHVFSLNDGCYEPSSTNISFRAQERDMYSYNNNMH